MPSFIPVSCPVLVVREFKLNNNNNNNKMMMMMNLQIELFQFFKEPFTQY